MKTSINNLKNKLLSAFSLLLFGLSISCTSFQEPDFSGTYVNTAGSEFSLANDTLVLEKADGQNYLIHRSTAFQLLGATGKPGKPQHEKEEWTTAYDSGAQLMREKRQGKEISFDADKKVMSVGRRKYKRIN